jgi:hypothetical protein
LTVTTILAGISIGSTAAIAARTARLIIIFISTRADAGAGRVEARHEIARIITGLAIVPIIGSAAIISHIHTYERFTASANRHGIPNIAGSADTTGYDAVLAGPDHIVIKITTGTGKRENLNARITRTSRSIAGIADASTIEIVTVTNSIGAAAWASRGNIAGSAVRHINIPVAGTARTVSLQQTTKVGLDLVTTWSNTIFIIGAIIVSFAFILTDIKVTGVGICVGQRQ